MAVYFVGDIQGCFSELSLLLKKVDFDKKTDELWVAGDMVARGTESLETLRFIISLGDSAKVVLGNHDLHLLATFYGLKKVKEQDNLTDTLNDPDVESMMEWLANQPLIQKLSNQDVYMSHAGLSPQWNVKTALQAASKAHKLIRSNNRKHWLALMYGELPNSWSESITEEEKFRFTINALTRMRFCHENGALNFSEKGPLTSAPATLKPWFTFSNHLTDLSWVFGHWASLEGKCEVNNIYPLDTGCVWGNHLTLLRWHDKKTFTQKSLRKTNKVNKLSKNR